MSKMTLLDVRLFAGGADLSGNSNKVEVMPEVEEKDDHQLPLRRVEGSPRRPGVQQDQRRGQWEAADPSKVDDASWAHARRGRSVDGLPD
jgi:hypothetical protein